MHEPESVQSAVGRCVLSRSSGGESQFSRPAVGHARPFLDRSIPVPATLLPGRSSATAPAGARMLLTTRCRGYMFTTLQG